jgi:hypothetical protein
MGVRFVATNLRSSHADDTDAGDEDDGAVAGEGDSSDEEENGIDEGNDDVDEDEFNDDRTTDKSCRI